MYRYYLPDICFSVLWLDAWKNNLIYGAGQHWSLIAGNVFSNQSPDSIKNCMQVSIKIETSTNQNDLLQFRQGLNISALRKRSLSRFLRPPHWLISQPEPLPRKILNLSNMSVDPELVVQNCVEKVTSRTCVYIQLYMYMYIYICLSTKRSQPLFPLVQAFHPLILKWLSGRTMDVMAWNWSFLDSDNAGFWIHSRTTSWAVLIGWTFDMTWYDVCYDLVWC